MFWRILCNVNWIINWNLPWTATGVDDSLRANAGVARPVITTSEQVTEILDNVAIVTRIIPWERSSDSADGDSFDSCRLSPCIPEEQVISIHNPSFEGSSLQRSVDCADVNCVTLIELQAHRDAFIYNIQWIDQLCSVRRANNLFHR